MGTREAFRQTVERDCPMCGGRGWATGTMTAGGRNTPPIARQRSLPDSWIHRQRMAMHVSKHAETQMRACRQSRRPAISRAVYTPNSGIKRRRDSKDPARRMRFARFT
ncbi:hypothetical protein TNCV_4924121 [Trichonephila clavipes]|nr:hypothetical protein TNCV_4924121 [Trichonephila clavipes]